MKKPPELDIGCFWSWGGVGALVGLACWGTLQAATVCGLACLGLCIALYVTVLIIAAIVD